MIKFIISVDLKAVISISENVEKKEKIKKTQRKVRASVVVYIDPMISLWRGGLTLK